MIKTMVCGILVFTTLATSPVAAIDQYPTPMRLIIKKDMMGCTDRGYFELIIRSLSDDAPRSPSDEAVLSMMHNGGCKTLAGGTVVTITEKRDRAGEMPPTACVQETSDVGCKWIIATTRTVELAQ